MAWVTPIDWLGLGPTRVKPTRAQFQTISDSLEALRSGITSATSTTTVQIAPTSPTTIIALPTATYLAVPTEISLQAQYLSIITPGNAMDNVSFGLYEDATLVCGMGLAGVHNQAIAIYYPLHLSTVITPTAGSHTYSIKSFSSGAGMDGYVVEPIRASARYA